MKDRTRKLILFVVTMTILTLLFFIIEKAFLSGRILNQIQTQLGMFLSMTLYVFLFIITLIQILFASRKVSKISPIYLKLSFMNLIFLLLGLVIILYDTLSSSMVVR
ncbi:MAG: hypothetical protein K9L74_03310 [Candidatus Izimaplasma sp.]|nr:hypothetical protein [Candidatus Izimaplasma bacterium]